MKYRKASDILPDKLLGELQKYVSGETIYVPKKAERKRWGEDSGSRNYYSRRNEDIKMKFRGKSSIDELADEYALSAETIRKIVYKV